MSDVAPAPTTTPSSAGSNPTAGGEPAASPAREVTTAAGPRIPAEVKPAAPKDPAAVAEKQRLKLKMKIDGQDVEEELDEDQIRTAVQLQKKSRQALSEAGELRKKFEAAVQLMKSDPEGAYKALGIEDFNLNDHYERKLAEKYRAVLEEANLTPEQKAQKEWEQKLQSERERAERAERSIQEREAAETHKRVATDTAKSIKDALAAGGLADNFENLYEMAQIMSWNLKHGIKMSPTQIASAVKDRTEQGWKRLETSLLSEEMSDDAVLKRVGEPFAKRVMKAYLAKIRPTTVSSAPAAPAPRRDPDADLQPSERRAKTKLSFRNAMLGRVE